MQSFPGGRTRDTDWLAMIDKDWPQVKSRLEAWLSPENFIKIGRAAQELERILRGIEMMTIRRQEIVKLEGCFASIRLLLDKLWTHQPQMLEKALSNSLANLSST